MNTTTLPALSGSEKQIAWAEQIREKKIPAIESIKVALYAKRPAFLSEAALAQISEEIEAFFAEITQNASAKFWIDKRESSMSANEFAEIIGKEIQLAVAEAVAEAGRVAKESWGEADHRYFSSAKYCLGI